MTINPILTLSEKLQLIRKNENNALYRTLAEKYEVSIGSVSDIIKRKIEYMYV